MASKARIAIQKDHLHTRSDRSTAPCTARFVISGPYLPERLRPPSVPAAGVQQMAAEMTCRHMMSAVCCNRRNQMPH